MLALTMVKELLGPVIVIVCVYLMHKFIFFNSKIEDGVIKKNPYDWYIYVIYVMLWLLSIQQCFVFGVYTRRVMNKGN